MKTLLGKMLVYAAKKHENQFDKGGNPYILHCLAVMHLLNSDDEELMCIALGHDLLEDTDATEKELTELGCSTRVIEGIKALTKTDGESYEDYKNKVKSNMDSITVKMADLTHNSDLRRLKGISIKDFNRVQKYMVFYNELKELKLNANS